MMRPLSADTRPEAERVWFDLMRQAPSWRKFQIIEDTSQMLKDNVMAGLRLRYPNASESELRRRLADAWLGPELAEKAYGPLSAALAKS
jgi:hypothetical protein